MRMRIKQALMASLVVTGILLYACDVTQNLTPTLQSSSDLATSTPIPITSTITPTSTSWISGLLTTTPTRYPLPTLPPDCGTVKSGSSGTQIIDNTQKILVQGVAILCGQLYIPIVGGIETITVLEGLIDLDTGTFNSENADFWFCPGGGSTIFYYLCDVNNSEVRKYQFLFENGKVLDPTQPSFEECLGTKPYTGINDDEAKYACVVTTLGNISRVKVERRDPLDHIMSVEISFITWGK